MAKSYKGPNPDGVPVLLDPLAFEHGDLKVSPVREDGTMRVVAIESPQRRSWVITEDLQLVPEPEEEWGER